MRREARRRLEQAREHRRFLQVHLAHRLVEVILRRGVDAVGAAAEIGAVEIKLEDFFFRQPRLQPHGEERLLHLALERALVVEEEVLRELLGDRRAALHHAAGARVGAERAEGAGEVDAEMLVEAAILGGEHRLDQMIGKFLQRHRVVDAQAAIADAGAVAIEEDDRELGFLQPILVGGLAEGGGREREHQNGAGGAEREAFRGHLHQEALGAGDVEAVHEAGEAIPARMRRDAEREEGVAEAGVEIEEAAAQRADLLDLERNFRLLDRLLVGHGRGPRTEAAMPPNLAGELRAKRAIYPRYCGAGGGEMA